MPRGAAPQAISVAVTFPTLFGAAGRVAKAVRQCFCGVAEYVGAEASLHYRHSVDEPKRCCR
jgi:hypothetical protein